MSGYFSRKTDAPDTEPFRRFYAEGGYVDDTSHDIDDVEAGLYGSQYFAGGGKVFSDFAKSMLGRLRPSKVGPAFDAADEALVGPAAKALEQFTAFPPNAYKNPDYMGVWNPQALDPLDTIPEMEPLRDLLHGHFGNTMPLARYQRDVPANTPPRKYLSWSSDPEFVSGFAGVKPVPRGFDEDFIRRMEQEYAETGTANISKYRQLVNKGGVPQIFHGGEHITDADSVRAYLDDLNDDRKWYQEYNDKKLKKVLTEKIPLEDILWGTDRGNQSEFIVRNRGYAEGGPVTDEDYGAYVSQYFDEGGQVEPEGYANGGLIRKWLKTIGDTMRQPLGVAVPEEVLPKIAEDGRFKSLFETGTSGGSKNTERRGNTELNMFGVPINADPSARPIYGHLFHPEEPDSIAGQYGDWISVLHPSVKNRATVTWGDSLDLTPDMNLGPYKFDQRPAELLRPRAQDKFSLRRGELYRDIPEDFRSLVRSDDVWWPGYLEAQIHGGLPWSDVTNLISVPAATPDAVRRAADRFGRPVYAQDALTENFPEPWLRAMPGASRVDEFIDGFPLSEIGYAEGGQVEEDDAPPRGYFGGC